MNEKIDNLNNLYNNNIDQWKEEKTMEHASGVWGRDSMLNKLKKNIVNEGDTVVDIGSGAGYPSCRIAEMVGEKGKVIGVELSKSMLGIEEDQEPLSKKYESIENLEFINGDIKNIPIKTESADEVVSFMVLHNIKINEIKDTLKETSRIMKKDGKAVFLTMHPDFLESDFDIDFAVYNEEDLEEYKNAQDKEGIKVRGVVRNAGGGEKEIGLFYHSFENLEKAAEEAGLAITDKEDFYIDEETAKEKFGEESVKKLPENPAFLMMTLEKINSPK